MKKLFISPGDLCKIIAVDFDGTLCSSEWPEIGEANEEIILYLKEQRIDGAKIILWTCRVGERLSEAVRWCHVQGLTFDAVNENIPEIIAAFGTDTRKIFANEYIDDRNVLINQLKHTDGTVDKSKIFVIGSLSRETEIKRVAEYYSKLGHEVEYVKRQSDKTFVELVCEAFRKISGADLIVAVQKEDGGLGDGTTYEVTFARFIGKEVIIFKN